MNSYVSSCVGESLFNNRGSKQNTSTLPKEKVKVTGKVKASEVHQVAKKEKKKQKQKKKSETNNKSKQKTEKQKKETAKTKVKGKKQHKV